MARNLVLVEADYLLATILSTTERVPFTLLREIQRKIEAITDNVVVDISSPEIYAALEYYPEIFRREDDAIAKATTADEYLASDYLKYEFTNSVPAPVHEKVREAIETLLLEKDKENDQESRRTN